MRPLSCADRIEVTQQRDTPARVRLGHVVQDRLGHELGLTVGIRRRQRERLVDGYRCRIAVHGRRRAEHEILDAMRLHGLDQREQAVDVVAIVGERHFDRLPHRLERGEVNGAGNAKAREQVVEHGLRARVALDKDRGAPGNFTDAPHRLSMAVDQIVENDHVIAVREQLDTGMRADVTGAAGHENGSECIHALPLRHLIRWLFDGHRFRQIAGLVDVGARAHAV